MSKVGIVIPTIFSRPAYLPLAAKSIRAAGDAFVLISSPEPTPEQQKLIEQLAGDGLIDEHLIETEGLPLALKISEGLSSLPKECQHIGWLGDDDILLPDALLVTSRLLDSRPDAVMAFGGVDYIDKNGQRLFTNDSAQFHEKLLRFGPQLIPQPGSLWRRSEFEAVGGLSGEFDLAFDFDLFQKLSRRGRLIHLPITLAQFRWHADSLSVKRRWRSVSEASRVRRKHYNFPMRILWPLWEPWVMLATWLAGKLVSTRYGRR